MDAINLIFLGWNAVVFALFGADKRRARKGQWRISERTLIACAFLCGGVGALLGMAAFRHKTRRTKFRVLLPLACALTIAVWVYALIY